MNSTTQPWGSDNFWRPPPPARLPGGNLVRRARGPASVPPNRLGSTASTFSERDLTDVDTPPPPPPQFLASVEAATKTAPGRTQLRAPSLDTALSVTDVDLGAVLLGDESSDDDDDDDTRRRRPTTSSRSRGGPRRHRALRGPCASSCRSSRRIPAERHVVKLQLIPDLSPRVTAYLERGDDAEVAPTPASGLRLVVEATGDAGRARRGPRERLGRRAPGAAAGRERRRVELEHGRRGRLRRRVSWKCVFVTREQRRRAAARDAEALERGAEVASGARARRLRRAHVRRVVAVQRRAVRAAVLGSWRTRATPSSAAAPETTSSSRRSRRTSARPV